MSKTNKLTYVIIAAFIGLCAFVGAVVFGVIVYGEDSPFEEKYNFGETLVLPVGDVEAGGNRYSVSPVILFPDGSAYSQDRVTLNQAGKYTVEYRKELDGKVYKESYSFIVPYPAYSVTTHNDSAAYTATAEGVEGLQVKLLSGSTFTYNKVIDLTDPKAAQSLMSFYVIPETKGAVDANWLYIKVADAADASNYFMIKIRQSPYGQNVLFISGRAHNQDEFYGIERGDPSLMPIPGQHGFAANGTFYGNYIGDKSYMVTLGYDNATQTLYAANQYYDAPNGNTVINFNDLRVFNEGWAGIESGKAVVSFYFQEYIKANAQLLLTDILGCDLTQETIETEVSDIVVDYGDYTPSDYPEAVVGSPYTIFPASSYELYTAEKIYVNVYTSYGSTVQANVDVKNSKFIPENAFQHVIEYTCIDGFGNRKVLAVPVTVKDSPTPIQVALDTSGLECVAGDVVVLPECAATGGEGKLTVRRFIQLPDGEIQEEEEGLYRFVTVGLHKLIYQITDYNGQTEKREISVHVGAATGPVFNEVPVLPLRYITDKKYSVPKLNAEDYSSGTLQEIPAVAEIWQNGSILPVEDGYFTVGEGDVTVKFIAVDAEGRKGSKEFVVPSVKAEKDSGDFDITKYFIAENSSVSADISCVTLRSDKNSSFTFIRELLATDFEISCNLDREYANMNSFVVLLTDYRDSSRSVSISVGKTSGNVATLSVNGNNPANTEYVFGGDIRNFNITLSGNTVTLGNTSLNINQTLDGKPFSGFSDYAFCKILFEGVSGDARLKLYSLNRQVMKEINYDVNEPRLLFTSSYGGEKNLGDKIELAPVYAIDVLDPYTELKFSVRCPGEALRYMTSDEGIELKDAACDRLNTITLSEYGNYIVSYSGQDGEGNPVRFTYVIICADTEGPVLIPAEAELHAKVGDEVTLPSYTCEDNVPAEPVVSIQVEDPNGKISTCATGKIKVDRAGKYIIRYFAVDDNFNTTLVEVVLNVA